MNIELSKKASIWVAVAVLILIVGGYFGVYSGLKYMQETATQISENKQTYLDKQDRLEKLSALNSKIDQARETLDLMNEALPTEEQQASSISILDSLVSRAGANLTSFVRSSDSDNSGGFSEDGEGIGQPQFETEQIDIALSGEYPEVSKFVGSLSNSRRPFSLNSIQLSDGGANITLTGYYLATQ